MGRLLKAAFVVCCIACLALQLTASAATHADDSGSSANLGDTLLAVVASATGAEQALTALGRSMALKAASERVQEELDTVRAAKAAAAQYDPPGPVVPGDPSTMPPASAGSNGTEITHHSAAEREKIFANTRAGGAGESTSILLTGIALPPPDAPQAVKDVINNANTIIGRPYIWGGGHGSFYSYGYDCSGAVSFALFGGGMIPRPLTSSELEGWGAPGPGKWITVYANDSHTYADIAGLRFDTSGTEKGTGPRWHIEARPSDDFVVRHPPGF